MKRYLSAAALVSGMLIILSASVSSFQRASSRNETALRSVVAGMTDAWNTGDTAGIAARFTDTGVLIAGDGTQRTGRAEIERYFAQLATSLPGGTRFTSEITSLRLVQPDMAVVISEGGFLLPGDTTVTPERHGVQSFVVVREGDAWRAALVQRTRILMRTPSNPR
jgi:uncharacterized protein (TIGR02246 family)